MPQNDNQKTIFLFCGEDTYSSTQKLLFWKNEFIKKYGEDSNIEVFEGDNMNIAQFDTNLETMPFLSDKRLIIIKNLIELGDKIAHEKVAKALEKMPDFCILVFHENGPVDKRGILYKKIKALGTVDEFNHLAPAEMTKWILNTAKKQFIIISNTTAGYLALHCGAELWRVSNELEKLKVFAEDKEVTTKMIDELVTPALSASIFKLTDSIAVKNANDSLKTFETLVDCGEELTMVFFMIVRHFRILIQVQDMAQKKEPQTTITKKLGQHPFVIQKTLSQCRNFNAKKLEEIYQKLLKIDTAFKTGRIKNYGEDNSEYKLAIEKFIVDCCQQ